MNSPIETLPSPSAALVLIRVFVSSFLATQPRKRGQAFLAHAATLLESEDALSVILPMRPASQDKDVARARQAAVRAFRALLPVFITALAGD